MTSDDRSISVQIVVCDPWEWPARQLVGRANEVANEEGQRETIVQLDQPQDFNSERWEYLLAEHRRGAVRLWTALQEGEQECCFTLLSRAEFHDHVVGRVPATRKGGFLGSMNILSPGSRDQA